MMAGGLHWLGVLFLFTASMLLLFVTLSAPIIHDFGLLRVQLDNGTSKNHHSEIYFGTFGWCTTHTALGHDWCTGRHIGYDPSRMISEADPQTAFGYLSAGTSDSLTRVMVLHPIACGFAFIAFLVSIGAGVIGSLAGASIAFVAWVLTIVSMAVDFTIFGIARHHVRKDPSLVRAYYGSAIWLLVAAFLLLLFGMVIVALTCFSNWRAKRKTASREGHQRKFGLFKA